jgi:hypothetical protein
MSKLQHPQRITRSAAPGSMLKGAQVIRMPQNEDNDHAYLAMVRQLPCLRCGMEPPPSNNAAHVRMQSAAHGKRGGIGKKPADCWTVPLCAACHTQDSDSQHKIGEVMFWHRVGLNPLYVCEKLYAQRGDIVAMRAVILQAIAERSRA